MKTILKVLLLVAVAAGFGALAQSSMQPSGSRDTPDTQNTLAPTTQGTGQIAPPATTGADQVELGTGGSGDGGMRHRGKHQMDAGM